MSTWFVSRHPGALQWLRAQGIETDHQVDHLDLCQVAPGDRVLGTLPINLAAEVCARGASYFHLSLVLPRELRGRELDAEDLHRLGARLEQCRVVRDQ